MMSSALPLIAACLAGALIASAAVLAVVRRMVTEQKTEQLALRGALEQRVESLEALLGASEAQLQDSHAQLQDSHAQLQDSHAQLSASQAQAASLQRSVELLRAEHRELEERLAIREEWVALRDEQLARNERKMQNARQHFAELQAERERERADAEALRGRFTEAQRALDVHDERSVAITEAARGLLKIVSDEDEVPPDDPMEAITQVAARIRGWFMSLSASSQELEAMRAENASMRRSLSATTEAYQGFRDRTEAELDFYAQSLAGRGGQLPEDLAPEVARAVTRRRASEIQLKATRAELDDLRTKLRFANRTIVALEAQLTERGPEAVVPDMLSGLRAPSYPPK